jgi:hypothetical protein
MTTTIRTPYGKKTITRRVGVAGEYYFEEPSPSAPHGAWWTLNPQTGFVPVPSNSPALLAALSHDLLHNVEPSVHGRGVIGECRHPITDSTSTGGEQCLDCGETWED